MFYIVLLLALRLLPLTKRLGPWGIEETDHLEIARTLGRSGNMGWNFQLFVRILYGPIYWTRSQGQSLALEKTISSRAFRYTLRVPNLLRCLAARHGFCHEQGSEPIGFMYATTADRMETCLLRFRMFH